MNDERELPGSRPIGLLVGAAMLAVLAALPLLIVVVFYLFANGYAIVTGPDFGSDTIDLGVLFTGLVLTVALLVIGLAAGANLLGRSLSPKRRR
jgi:hypothetical protein